MADIDAAAIRARRARLIAAALAAAGVSNAGCSQTAQHVPSTSPRAEPDEPVAPPIDSDSDGVPDERDHCPDVAGVDTSTSRGCPPQPCLSIIPNYEIKVVTRIYFDRGSAALKSAAKPLLTEIAQVFAEHPELRVVVVGHRLEGEPSTVASARAETVPDELLAHGLTTERMELRAEACGPGNEREQSVSFDVIPPL